MYALVHLRSVRLSVCTLIFSESVHNFAMCAAFDISILCRIVDVLATLIDCAAPASTAVRSF
jgi:hypothetical protein